MLKTVTFKEIDQIFAILEELQISREAVVIPLRPDHPGRASKRLDGKLEIIVERDDDFESWLPELKRQMAALMKPAG